MDRTKQARLRKAGWNTGSAGDFLRLSAEEEAMIEMKLALAKDLQRRRRLQGMTQTQLAKRLGSSQSRVAKMEAVDGSVSMDLLVRSLLTLGATPRALARSLTAKGTRHAA